MSNNYVLFDYLEDDEKEIIVGKLLDYLELEIYKTEWEDEEGNKHQDFELKKSE